MRQLSWYCLIKSVHWWSKYLDQWTKFKFETEYGTIYVSIERENMYPDSFEEIDASGNYPHTYPLKEEELAYNY